MEKTINLTLKVWRQNGPKEKGRFETYKLDNISTDSSFLEMMDILNEQLISENKEPVAFDHHEECLQTLLGSRDYRGIITEKQAAQNGYHHN